VKKHLQRLWLSVLGRWKPDPRKGWEGMHEDRQSGYKGYVGELGHSLKNVAVEWLREKGIWDRGKRNTRR
jgi:hypothetical protein